MDRNPDLDRLCTSAAIRVEPWEDTLVEAHGYDVRSSYVEAVYLPVLGPTSLLLARRLAVLMAAEPRGFVLDVADIAAQLGLGRGSGRNSVIARTLARLVIFDVAQVRDHGDTLAVRRALAPLPLGHQRRLSPTLRRAHEVALLRREATTTRRAS